MGLRTDRSLPRGGTGRHSERYARLESPWYTVASQLMVLKMSVVEQDAG